MAEPLDFKRVDLFLDFVSDGTGLLQIAEPVGFDASALVLKQDNGRLGRDVTFASGDIDLEFYSLPEIGGFTHQFDKLIEYYKTYGVNSIVRFVVRTDGVDRIVGDLDFPTATTDLIKEFKCTVIQDSLQAKIKRRRDINVDLFSSTDVDGNPITPLSPQSVLLKATPLKTISEWEGATPLNVALIQDRNAYFTLTPALTRSDIDDSLTPEYFEYENNVNDPTSFGAGDNYTFLRASNTLTNVTLNLSEFNYNTNIGTSQGLMNVVYQVGETYSAANNQTVSMPLSATNFSTTIDLGSVSRDQTVWVFFHVLKFNTSASVSGNFNSGKINIQATSTSIDSVTQSVRLYDAMQQVVTSISGATIDAPRFAPGGEFYDNFLFTGTLIRGITDRAFNITLDDIVDQLQEVRGDYEITPDGNVFFGIFDDFNRNIEMASFTMPPTLEYSEKFKEEYLVNKLTYKYDKYEKGRNDNQENSLEGVHTECQMLLPTNNVENEKEINVPFVRDPFYIEKIRRQGIEVSDETAKEQDDEISIVDVYTETGVISKSEGMLVTQIIFNTTNLRLVNQGDFSFNLLGITVNDQITFTGENGGTYVVTELAPSYISLTAVVPTPNPTFQGQSYITLNYNVTATNLVMETNQDFNLINGSTDPSGFANLKYTPKRNIKNYYGQYLATCCQFNQADTITNTLFRHNGDLETRLNSEPISTIEKEDIPVNVLGNPILSMFEVHAEVFADFDTVWQLMLDARTTRGYISLVSTDDTTIRVHANKLSFDWARNVLTIDGDKRF